MAKVTRSNKDFWLLMEISPCSWTRTVQLRPDEIEKNLKFFQEGYDIVIGSRVLQSYTSKVKALLYRKSMGWIFNFLVSTFLIKGIKDTQCGFKMFRREIIRPLWENIQIQGFGFDLEVLFLAQQMNYKIKEVAG